MTIETLMHIYLLLKEDVELKEYLLENQRKAFRAWYQNTDDTETEYPEQNALDLACEARDTSRKAFVDFTLKEWK